MKCLHCQSDLIKGDQHPLDKKLYGDDYEEWNIVTILACPTCKAFVEVFAHTDNFIVA
tara:strand:+ start:1664 stop:1837 length:174 start_codon:yes stop_codon:yes gene_type:complete